MDDLSNIDLSTLSKFELQRWMTKYRIKYTSFDNREKLVQLIDNWKGQTTSPSDHSDQRTTTTASSSLHVNTANKKPTSSLELRTSNKSTNSNYNHTAKQQLRESAKEDAAQDEAQPKNQSPSLYPLGKGKY